MNRPMEEGDAGVGHPADVDLVAYADGELTGAASTAIEDHLAACATCGEALRELDAKLGVRPPYGALVAIPAMTALFQEPQGEPTKGELWRLEWDDDILLVAVTAATDGVISVAPVTFEGPADPIATEVPSEDSPIDAPLYIWNRLARTVPLGVFLAPAGAVPTRYLSPADEIIPFHEATALLLVQLAGTMDRLGDAWRLEAEAEALSVLPALLKGTVPTQIKAATGIPPAVITDLLRGVRRPTPDQARRLADYFQVPVLEVTGRLSIPRALAQAVERPTHRAALRARAALQQVTEKVMRKTIAEEVLGLPARSSRIDRDVKDRDVETWDQLVRHYLDE